MDRAEFFIQLELKIFIREKVAGAQEDAIKKSYLALNIKKIFQLCNEIVEN